MEMNNLNYDKCQKSRKWDTLRINGKFNDNKTKCNSVIFSILKTKNHTGLEKVQKVRFCDFRERRS